MLHTGKGIINKTS